MLVLRRGGPLRASSPLLLLALLCALAGCAISSVTASTSTSTSALELTPQQQQQLLTLRGRQKALLHSAGTLQERLGSDAVKDMFVSFGVIGVNEWVQFLAKVNEPFDHALVDLSQASTALEKGDLVNGKRLITAASVFLRRAWAVMGGRFNQIAAQQTHLAENLERVVNVLKTYHIVTRGATQTIINSLKFISKEANPGLYRLAVVLDVIWAGVSSYADGAIEQSEGAAVNDQALMLKSIALAFFAGVDDLTSFPEQTPDSSEVSKRLPVMHMLKDPELRKDVALLFANAGVKGLAAYANAVRAHKNKQEAMDEAFAKFKTALIIDGGYNLVMKRLLSMPGAQSIFGKLDGKTQKDVAAKMILFMYELPWRMAIEPALDVIFSHH